MLSVVGRRPRSARAHGRDRSRDGGRPHLPRDARGSPRRRPRPCGARKARRGRQEISGDGGEGRSLGRPSRGARDSRGGETHGRERSRGDVEPRGGRRSDVFSGGNLRTSCGLCPGRGGLRPGTRWHGSRAGRRRRVEAGSVSRFVRRREGRGAGASPRRPPRANPSSRGSSARSARNARKTPRNGSRGLLGGFSRRPRRLRSLCRTRARRLAPGGRLARRPSEAPSAARSPSLRLGRHDPGPCLGGFFGTRRARADGDGRLFARRQFRTRGASS